MSWLATLDARATRWPRALRGSYLTLKWFLVVMGAWCLAFTAFQGEIGLGVGVAVAFLVALINTLLEALSGRTAASAPAPSPRR